MMLVNGEYKEHIEISDRGFQYGDGLFETIAVTDGQPVFLDRHLDRLKAGCLRLYIPFPGTGLLIQEAQKLCRHSSKAVLKLILTRGSGGRGYRQPDVIQTTRVLSLYPFPDYPDIYKEQGIVVRFCNTRLGLNPALAGIKHLNRLEQILARAEWTDSGIQEGIMLDSNDHVIEGTMTNLFYIRDNTLYTSLLIQSGVAGIMRSIIMTISSGHGLSVMEHTFTKDELLLADEVFVCNSIIGIWPIRKIANTFFPVGLLTRQIQIWLAQFKNEASRGD
ncbi:MAG: aminodeoxychorismate lyase [Methylococcaceae bacterium]|jgi:4-amino-4-deoxychorismate lyase|nr:aminodeoxychorismate lyase [Methylococcaceae bacterium]MDD1642732.1 aminodeoxychorismate lyase [Methylococcaceae bacterium]